MSKVKGSTVETIETPSGAHVGSSGYVETPFETNPALPQCEVELGIGFTEPTKPYGNVKVFVGIKVQCDVGEQDAIFDFCNEWVDEKLSAKMAEIKVEFPD